MTKIRDEIGTHFRDVDPALKELGPALIIEYLPNSDYLREDYDPMNKFIKSVVGVESIFFIFESLFKLKEKILTGMDTKQHSFVA